ncbi:MAG: acyl dehydratase [Limisphaerales bacterium]
MNQLARHTHFRQSLQIEHRSITISTTTPAATDNPPFYVASAAARIGETLGVSDWVFIDQTQVNIFGEVTRWRTPGHCDPEFAKAGPYGGTLMHGFHMLGLLSHFFKDSGLHPKDAENPLNYGLDKVRVLKPVIIGDGVKLRSHISLLEAQPKPKGEVLLKTCHQIEVEGVEGFVMYAEYLTYWHPKKDR